jgi:hypothetical protein
MNADLLLQHSSPGRMLQSGDQWPWWNQWYCLDPSICQTAWYLRQLVAIWILWHWCTVQFLINVYNIWPLTGRRELFHTFGCWSNYVGKLVSMSRTSAVIAISGWWWVYCKPLEKETIIFLLLHAPTRKVDEIQSGDLRGQESLYSQKGKGKNTYKQHWRIVE